MQITAKRQDINRIVRPEKKEKHILFLNFKNQKYSCFKPGSLIVIQNE